MTGLVVGKFYPPHAGHHFLIETALASCERVRIIVIGRPDESPDMHLRAQWIKGAHPTADVVTTVDDIPDAPEPWAKRTLELFGEGPDEVFTSEAYGPGFAKALGAAHVSVDPDRTRFPVSGTDVRQDPLGHWEFLREGARRHCAFRVILVGAESTGKSTLSAQLAEHFQTLWVPEYGREYTEKKYTEPVAALEVGEGDEWTSAEFVHIAQEQQRQENEAAGRCNRLLIADTNAFATAIWHERYKGFRHPEVEEIAARDRADLYLIPAPDLPFHQDGIRDGETIRQWMHDRFLEEVGKSGVPYAVISGLGPARFESALRAIQLRGPF
jgi:HTH-type transcriptional regulator, transcriptional repressor of NAD biosynthesis genes